MANHTISGVPYKVIADYDNDNGDTITNNLDIGVRVGLTETDGVTIDIEQTKFVGPNNSITYPSGLGSGRKLILFKQANTSTLNGYDITIS